MKEEPIPFDKFARIGIYPKDLERMPEGLRETILTGKLSPLMRLDVPLGDNSSVSIPMKIQLVYDKDDKLQLLTYQIQNDIQTKLQLNAAELERVRKGEVIQKEFRNDNDRKLRYVQLDKETNSLMYRVVVIGRLKQTIPNFLCSSGLSSYCCLMRLRICRLIRNDIVAIIYAILVCVWIRIGVWSVTGFNLFNG